MAINPGNIIHVSINSTNPDNDIDSDEDTLTTAQTMIREKPKLTCVKIREMLEDLMHSAHTEDTSFCLLLQN